MRSRNILFFLALVISLLEGFFNNNVNGYLQLVLALLSSVVAFYMPQLQFKIGKLLTAIIFLANTAIIAFTYCVFDQRIFLMNMLIMSCILWRIITPYLLKFRMFLPITFLISFISVYAVSLLNFSTPLFVIVFFPVYVLGAIVQKNNIIYNKKTFLFGLANIILSGIFLLIFLFKSLGLEIIDSILFLKIARLGAVTALYLPFIAVSMAWFFATGNFLIYMPFAKFVKWKASFELTSLAKPVANFIGFVAVALLSTFICEFSIRQNFDQTLRSILDPNLLFNIFLMGSIYLVLISILGKGISNIIIGLVTLFLALANYIKITYFDEPFYPWDLYLVQNLFGIAKAYINLPLLLAVIAVITIGIFLTIRFRSKVAKYLKPKISFVLLPFSVIFFLISANVLTTYSLSSQLGITKSWYIGKNEILTNGVFAQNYFYLNDLDKYLNPKPEGYNEAAMLAIEKKYTTEDSTKAAAANSVKPNVVMVMSESFWDVNQLNDLSFNKDVMKNVQKYQKGLIAAPVIGGGTANTEFEALTGLSMYFLSPGIITYNAYLRTETPSIATVFKNNGYATTAIHPNSAWFYNRDKVYNYFGFDKFIDISGFDLNTQVKGTHISDEAFTDKVLETLNSSDKPAFIFALSIENHDPYENKYTTKDVTASSDKLDNKERNIISNYAQGVYDADQAFGRLIDEISKSDEPTLVYFFGDHAPRLGSLEDYYRIYDKLGSIDKTAQKQGPEKLKYFTTPFASYSNYKQMPALSKILSPAHISYEVLRDSGVSYPNYFNILPKLEKSFPVMHLLIKNLVDDKSELVKDYHLIEYDLLFGKKYLGK